MVNSSQITPSPTPTLIIVTPAPDPALSSVNISSIVEAGPRRSVVPGSSLIISDSANDEDGDIVDYKWTQILGTAAKLADENTPLLTFTAPDNIFEELLSFELTVTDDFGSSASAQVNVLVKQIPSVATGRLNDTGVYSCFVRDASLEYIPPWDDPKPSIICGQDGHYGRDHLASIDQLPKARSDRKDLSGHWVDFVIGDSS